MPLYHCDKCHHEWEYSEARLCDWCGATCHVISHTTPFEKMLKWLYSPEGESSLARWIATRRGDSEDKK